MSALVVTLGAAMPAGDYVLRNGDTMPRPGAKVWLVVSPVVLPREDGTLADTGLWVGALWVRTAPKAQANGARLDGYSQFATAQGEDYVAVVATLVALAQGYKLEVAVHPQPPGHGQVPLPPDPVGDVLHGGRLLAPGTGGSNPLALFQKLLALVQVTQRLRAAASEEKPQEVVTPSTVVAAAEETATTPMASTASTASAASVATAASSAAIDVQPTQPRKGRAAASKPPTIRATPAEAAPVE